NNGDSRVNHTTGEQSREVMNILAILTAILFSLAACFASPLDNEQQPQQHWIGWGYEQYLDESPVKRAQTFVRFGKRGQWFVRLGR
ncbi:hypothetical protein PENTCL1PPCAC_21485, partial [Pristionchus entomophagus]